MNLSLRFIGIRTGRLEFWTGIGAQRAPPQGGPPGSYPGVPAVVTDGTALATVAVKLPKQAYDGLGVGIGLSQYGGANLHEYLQLGELSCRRGNIEVRDV